MAKPLRSLKPAPSPYPVEITEVLRQLARDVDAQSS